MSAKELIRTPLGGFINHEPVIKDENASGELVEVSGPNCEKIKQRADCAKIEWRLVTRKDIKAGDELTLEYTFYKI
jgi:SET domain-containing protein